MGRRLRRADLARDAQDRFATWSCPWPRRRRSSDPGKVNSLVPRRRSRERSSVHQLDSCRRRRADVCFSDRKRGANPRIQHNLPGTGNEQRIHARAASRAPSALESARAGATRASGRLADGHGGRSRALEFSLRPAPVLETRIPSRIPNLASCTRRPLRNKMKLFLDNLELFLRLAALAQLGVAVLNLFLVRIMKWQRDLVSAPLLIREVFQIHIYFISITLAVFGALTWRFAGEIANAAHPICVWLAIGIGVFWAIRSVMQWSHYSAVHWRGDRLRTFIHWMLFLGYGLFAAVYFTAAARGVL